MIHELKTINPYFQKSYEKQKTFEVRNNDRNFKVGDIVRLNEYHEKRNFFSGRYVEGVITYILREYSDALNANYCVFLYKETKRN